jgi:hypothetical protein
MYGMKMAFLNAKSHTWLFLLRQDSKFGQLNLKCLHLHNLWSRSAMVGPNGPVVSVTTYGPRLKTVYLTLESIACGSILPSRLLLWIDDLQILRNPPPPLRRLVNRGLEIRPTADYGPHKKYYPYLLSAGNFDSPLVTADDDVLYSRWWLSGLLSAHNENPLTVNCYRAHVMDFAEGKLRPYRTWTSCRSTEPSFCHFATGSSGCLYPATFLNELKRAGAGFQDLCPKADDVWLNANALRAGFKTRQIRRRSVNFPFLPGTQHGGLSQTNVGCGENDEQIRKTYTSADVAHLMTCAG